MQQVQSVSVQRELPDNEVVSDDSLPCCRGRAHSQLPSLGDAHGVPAGWSTGMTRMVSSLMDDEGAPLQADATWDCLRRRGFHILHRPSSHGAQTSVFDIVVGVVVVFNILTMIIETDASAACAMQDSEMCVPGWVNIMNDIFLGIYTAELALRLFVHRRSFFRSKWNMLDCTIVVCGLLGIFLSDVDWFKRVNILRLLRVARIIRLAAILNRFPVLMHFIGGFIGAMQAMFWGTIVILTMLVMWSLMAVQIIYPVSVKLDLADDNICKDAFSSVFRSTLTFFQTLVAGDSWGACAIPIINQAPHTYLVFALALVTVQLGFTNLVLAVIVDKANEARELQREQRRREKRNAEAECLKKWKEMMTSLDTDDSGTICKDELMAGYWNQTIGDQLKDMNIGSHDLSTIFELMDCDDSGEVSYNKFIECFHKAQQQDARVYMMILQLRVQSVESRLISFMERMSSDRVGPGGPPRGRASRGRAGVQHGDLDSEGCSGRGAPTAAQPPGKADTHSGDNVTTVLPPLCVVNGELLQSLRDSIDRRLDAIVAEAVASMARMPAPMVSAGMAADTDSSPRSRAQVVSRTRPTTRPSPDLDMAEPASGERPLPSPPRPLSPRPASRQDANTDNRACGASPVAAKSPRAMDAVDGDEGQTLRA